MNEPLYYFNGKNGQLEVYPDKVIIKRKGFMSKMTQGFFAGEKSIYIKQITGIKVKRGGLLTNGFIQFILAGNIEVRKGLVKETHDENTIFFAKKDNEVIDKIKLAVEELMTKSDSPHVVSSADEILKFKNLLDDGVITQEEFEEKKKQLLHT